MSSAKSWKRRLFKWLLAGGAFLLLALGALVLFLPAILSSDFVRERIARGIADRLGSEVELESIRFSWGGHQEARGLRVASPTAGEEDILRAESVVLGNGLLALLELAASGEGTISVAIERPVLHIRRDAEGRFNFERLFPRRGDGPSEEPGRGPPKKAPAKGPSPQVRIDLRGGLITYHDQELGTASRVEGLRASLDARPAEVDLEAEGTVREEGGSPGPFQVTVRATGLEGAEGTPDVKARAEFRDLDLRPYRALLERLARVSAPEKPVTGSFEILSGERGLDLEGALDAGFGRLEKVACAVPRRGAGDRSTLSVPWTLELSATLAFLGPRIALPEGAHVMGRAAGTLTLSAPLTLEELSAGGMDRSPLEVRLDAKGEDLDVLWPRGAADAGGSPEEPIRIEGGAATLSFLLERPAQAEGAEGEGGAPGTEGGTPGPKRWKGTGRVDLRGPLRHGGVSLEGLSSDVRFDGQRLELPGLACRLNGGNVRAEELSLDLEGTPAYRIVLGAEQVAAHQDMAPLLAYVLPFLSAADRDAEFSGSLQGRLELGGRGFALDDLRKTLVGRGSLRVAQGRIAASPFFRELAGLLGTSLDRVLFHELGSDFTLGEGRITSSKLFLQGREGSSVRSIAFDGWTDLDGKLDYGMKLSSLKDSIGDKRARRVLEYAERFLGGGLLPLRVRGTVAAPKLSLELDAAGLDLGGLDLGGLDVGGLDLGGILEGVIPRPGSKDAEGEPSGAGGGKKGSGSPEKPAPPKDPREALERGLREILEGLRKRD